MDICFATSLTLRVSREQPPHSKCLLPPDNVGSSSSTSGGFVIIQIHVRVPHTYSYFCSRKRFSPSAYRHASPTCCNLTICPLCTGITPGDGNDDSTKDKTSSATNAAENSLPKISFWTAAAAEAGIGILGIMLCTATNVSLLGPKFSLSSGAILHACQTSVAFFIIFWLIDRLPINIGKEADAQYRMYFENRRLLDVAILCLCVAFGEELLFRAWLLNVFCNIGLSKPLALTLSAVLFGVLHAQNIVYVTLASIGGALFGLMLLSTGSILEPLVVHFIYDFGVILLLRRKWRSQDKENEKTK